MIDVTRASAPAAPGAAGTDRSRIDPSRRPSRLVEIIADLDEIIAAQLNAILAAPSFRRVERAWRSLDYLVRETPRDAPIHLKVLNVSRSELVANFEDASVFDRSDLFHLVHDLEYGRFEGEPYGLLVADFEFAHGVEDVMLLRDLAAVAATAHVVLLAGASAEIVGLESWSEFSLRTVPADLADNVAYEKWNNFREREDARYVGLVLPRVLLRLPYRPGDGQHLRLEENRGLAGDARLFGCGAFVLASRIMHAFDASSWPVAIRGLYEGQGVVSGLPLEQGSSDGFGLAARPPVELVVVDAQDRALSDLGLIPICRVPGTPALAFFSVLSPYRPRPSRDRQLSANLQLASQLTQVLAVSRLAHYLKMLMRQWIGSNRSRDELLHSLSNFLLPFALDDTGASASRKAACPLRTYNVELQDRADRPGVFDVIVTLQPQYQIYEPNVILKLTTAVGSNS